MGWEEQLFALFDDLESQAEGLFHAERELEIQDRGQTEYQQVTLASRLMASLDAEVGLEVLGVGRVRGVLQRVGDGWCLLESGAQAWIVRLAAVGAVRGASERSLPEAAWPAVTKLAFGSTLRRIASARERCHLRLVDGSAYDVLVRRVGRDFVEAVTGHDTIQLFAFDAIAAVQQRESGVAR